MPARPCKKTGEIRQYKESGETAQNWMRSRRQFESDHSYSSFMNSARNTGLRAARRALCAGNRLSCTINSTSVFFLLQGDHTGCKNILQRFLPDEFERDTFRR